MKRRFSRLSSWLLIIVITGLVSLGIRTWVLVPATVVGTSMRPTLEPGNYLVLQKFGQIKRFEVIVFKLDGTTYIKRVIGLPGERVSYKDDQLSINDHPVAEPFLTTKKDQETVLTSDFDLSILTGHQTVPKGHYFVLGDNRRISKDSRTFGPIDETTIIGRAKLVYYPVSRRKLL